MNPDEKTEKGFAPEPDEQEGVAEEPVEAGLEQAEQGHPPDVPDGEEREGSAEESVPEAEKKKRGGRLRADGSKLKSILEAMIFVSEQPISLDRMVGVLPDCPRKKLKELLDELEQEYADREGALEIVQVANGYQFRTRAEFAPWLGRLRQQKFARLSRAALETLAIVAYRQPVTRAEAESIRGVDSGAVLGTLLERRLLRILGRKEVPGRPILYGTTHDFLELFGLNSLKDLPTLREIKDMVDTAQEEAEGQEAQGVPAEVGVGEGEAGAEEGPAESGDEASAPSGEDEEEYEDDEEDQEGSDEEEWSEDGEPLGEEEISPLELDEILKSTKTKLEIYEADLEPEEGSDQAAGSDQTEPAEGEEETKKAGEGDNPDEG